MKRLRVRLLILALLPLVLMLTIGGLVYRSTAREAALEEWRQRILEQVELKRMVVDDWLAERRREITYLSEAAVWSAGTLQEQYASALHFLSHHDAYTALVVANVDGSVRLDSALQPPLTRPGISLADRGYFLTARAGRPNISRVIVGRTSGERIIIVAAPLYREDTVHGVIFGPVSLDTVDSVIDPPEHRAKIRTFLIDALNRPITALPETANTDYTASLPDVRLPSIDGVAQSYDNIGGHAVLGARYPLENKGWYLVGEATLAKALRTFDYYNSLLRSTLVVLLTLSAGAVWFLARSVERPIEQLIAMSYSIDRREYDQAMAARPPKSAPLEMVNLHRAFRDMAYRLRQFVQQLQTMSITDPLTGLPNRRHFEAEIRREISNVASWNIAGSLLLADLDHFKSINDRRGHAAGDRILQGFSEILRRTLRESDLPARIGGEEFAVLAPRTPAREASELAHRLRRATQEELGVTVSIGVAEVSPDGDPFGADPLRKTFEAADQALYASKRRGRNRVTVHGVDR